MDSENMVCTVLLTRDDPYITKIPWIECTQIF
jgi:hypothetical protein